MLAITIRPATNYVGKGGKKGKLLDLYTDFSKVRSIIISGKPPPYYTV